MKERLTGLAKAAGQGYYLRGYSVVFKVGDRVKTAYGIGTIEDIPNERNLWVHVDGEPENQVRGIHLDKLEFFTMGEVKRETKDDTNPKDLLGIKKVQLNLVPPSSIVYEALAMEDGARKYGPYNWRTKKVKASIYIGACLRHVTQWLDGEELTVDTGVPNLGAAKACLGIIIDAMETGCLVDDRPPAGPASKLIERYKKSS